jgi:thiamine-monophosphate kinase
MTELERVRWIARLGRGIGDDCAILPNGNQDLLLTTDLFLEDVHFRREQPAGVLGHRALARGLSDIAAMGGTPRSFLVSLALGAWSSPAWMQRFYQGMLKLARKYRCDLVGGDLSHQEKVAVDIVVVGAVPRGSALRRDTARPGDAIYVSGTLGGQPASPEPRIPLGRYLRRRATACMDLSDGLSIDLHRLCLASRVAAVIDRPLPIAQDATLDDALGRGEDYELLFTTREPLRFYRGLPLTRIGTIIKGRPGSVTLFGLPMKISGYDHFARR